ncbi:MAG: preprotein translocase subunit SecE [Bacteroidales bacterium]|nr:preprotein translocase subunit SecE [Bacteroidales bacterium]
MSKIGVYFKESYTELTRKVSWPSWSELQSSAITVMVASVILAAIIFVLDYAFRNLMELVYNLLY